MQATPKGASMSKSTTDHCPACGSQLFNVGLGECNNIWSRNFWHVEKEFRQRLDAFHSRQVSRYLEVLKGIPAGSLPKSGLDLCNDYLEFLAMEL